VVLQRMNDCPTASQVPLGPPLVPVQPTHFQEVACIAPKFKPLGVVLIPNLPQVLAELLDVRVDQAGGLGDHLVRFWDAFVASLMGAHAFEVGHKLTVESS